jgi:hypothetical protein
MIISNLPNLFPEIAENQFFVSLKDRLRNTRQSNTNNVLDCVPLSAWNETPGTKRMQQTIPPANKLAPDPQCVRHPI